MISCGVPTKIYDRYADESKYKIARHLLSDLDSIGEEGYLIQKRILTNLWNLRSLPDDNVPNRNAGLDALRKIKPLALDQKLIVKKERSEKDSRLEELRRKSAEPCDKHENGECDCGKGVS